MSAIPTCAVRAIVRDSVGGLPIEGATVVAKLSSYEVYDGYVVPLEVEGVTDADGECILNLWPNELGSVSSFYSIRITGNDKTLRTNAVVPNLPEADLHAIANLPVYEGMPDGTIVLGEVVALATQALASKNAAKASEESAAASESVAVESKDTAVSAASQASSDAASALASKNAAADSESVAVASESSAVAASAAAADSEAVASAAEAGAVASAAAAADSEAFAEKTLTVWSPTAPPDPISGAQWVNSNTGRRFTWIVDEASSQWVETGTVVSVPYNAISDAVAAAAAAENSADSANAALTGTTANAATATAAAGDAVAAASAAAATLTGAAKKVDLESSVGPQFVGDAARSGQLTRLKNIHSFGPRLS